jgi:DNA repair protein RecN (Recombination protein N)
MLSALRISQFAVIDEVEIAFGKGLTVLTGETGAGKSILVDALGLLLGGRADPAVIRAGSEEACVEAVVSRTPKVAERLAAQGLPDLGEEVSLRRIIGRTGRGKAYVNGALVTVGVLGSVMRGIIDLADQHEQVHLYEPPVQRELLDGFTRNADALSAYRGALERVRELDAQLEQLGGDERRVAERLEFVRFQIDELARVDPKAGEDGELELERRRLASAEKLGRAASEAIELVAAEEGGAIDRLGRARRLLEEASRFDPTVMNLAAPIEAAIAEAEEALGRLTRYVGAVEADPARLSEVDDRLEELKRLSKKHAIPIAQLAARRDELEAERARLENRGEALQKLTDTRAKADAEAWRLAAALHDARIRGASRLTSVLREGLTSLALSRARFWVEVRPLEQLGADGADHVEFLFSANLGEPLRPLSKVASGGEASRVLLALKRGLAEIDDCGCYVLDEADAGVSGAVADVVGRLIREIASRKQVLCITHLPQVAAHADAHLVIRKRVVGERTCSEVDPLRDGNARTRELARMLSGVKVTKEAIGAAEALVRSARRRGTRARLKVA